MVKVNKKKYHNLVVKMFLLFENSLTLNNFIYQYRFALDIYLPQVPSGTKLSKTFLLQKS